MFSLLDRIRAGKALARGRVLQLFGGEDSRFDSVFPTENWFKGFGCLPGGAEETLCSKLIRLRDPCTFDSVLNQLGGQAM